MVVLIKRRARGAFAPQDGGSRCRHPTTRWPEFNYRDIYFLPRLPFRPSTPCNHPEPTLATPSERFTRGMAAIIRFHTTREISDKIGECHGWRWINKKKKKLRHYIKWCILTIVMTIKSQKSSTKIGFKKGHHSISSLIYCY